MGKKNKLDKSSDFTCGSGSLLLNVRTRIKDNEGNIGKIFGQEKISLLTT
jgi:type I restriction enzyme M protein